MIENGGSRIAILDLQSSILEIETGEILWIFYERSKSDAIPN
jgi:hypothetical protein